MSLLARTPLVMLLALTATAELVLNRIGLHVVRSSELRETVLYTVLDYGGQFTLYLTGLLGAITLTWAVLVLIRDQRLLKVPDRIALTFLAAFFVPVATLALVTELPPVVAPHLNSSFALLLLVLIIVFVRQPAALRAKLGVLYLAVPMLLHAYWLLTQQLPMLAPSGKWSELPGELLVAAEQLAVVGAFAIFLFFTPPPRLRSMLRPIPLTLAAQLTAGAALFAKYGYLEAAQCAYYGFGFNLPPPSMHGLLHLVALFLLLLTLGVLVLRERPQRATALGLYLIVVSGFQLELPHQFLLTLLGMLQLMRSALAAQRSSGLPVEPPSELPSPEDWNAYLQRLSGALSQPAEAGETALLQHDGQQIARLRGERAGQPWALRILQQGGRVERLEMIVGELPRTAAPLAITRRRGCRGRTAREKAGGKRIRLALPALEQSFRAQAVSGAVAEALLAESVREPLTQLIHGWLGLWPGESARYVALPDPDGWPLPLAQVAASPAEASTQELERLLDLLLVLARAAPR